MMGTHTTEQTAQTESRRMVYYKEVGDGWLAHRKDSPELTVCPIGYGRTRLAALEALTDNERRTITPALA